MAHPITMRKRKPITRILSAIFMVVIVAVAGITLPAKAVAANNGKTPATDAIPGAYQGDYYEVNNGLKSYILGVTIDENGFFIGERGFYDLAFGYRGEVTNLRELGNGVSFDCSLVPADGIMTNVDNRVHVTLTLDPSGVYELKMTFKEGPDERLAYIDGPVQMYKGDGHRIDGTVPAKLGNQVTIAGLIKALTPYVFKPEILSTRMYLKRRCGLDNTETVRQDERNRYLEYAWGEEGHCMDCKYWKTKDGNILLVVNFHDATYQYPQTMRFFLFDLSKGTLRELRTAMSDKWPINGDGCNPDIAYQVRYYSDGIVALVPQTDGDSFDVVTLKFDGEIFR